MNRLLVSAVMVTCNVDRFPSEAIESILDQTLIDFEFIITDYGSTDRSKSIISRYEAKDRLIKPHTIPTVAWPTHAMRVAPVRRVNTSALWTQTTLP
jgi:glycosyltransferase involved in cell wall biosynthesis